LRPLWWGLATRRRLPRNTSPNTLGHRVTFAVDDIDDVLARLRAHGVELLSKVAQYKDGHRLCYIRTVGPG
jgi:catechol 2,3-dioxygenase-like lactoylglutathione lyase family enzyme